MLNHLELCELAYTKSKGTFGFAEFLFEDVIAISGTDNNFDWYLNSNCFPLIRGYHRQFYLEAERICKKYPNIKSFTGHSAGGAISHICADLNKGEALSFAAPRIKHGLGGKHFSVELQYDPVTKININAVRSQNTTLVLPGLSHHVKKYRKALMLQNLN